MTIIGIDIGGTRTRIAAFNRAQPRAPIARREFMTHPLYADQLHRIVETIGSLNQRPNALGVSICGRISADGRVVVNSLNLPDYEGVAIADDLAARVGSPAFVAHDATCGLLGEHWYGVLAARSNSAYVTVSTGIGAAIQIGTLGRTLIRTIEAGHQLITSQEVICACGQRGCVDALLGGRQVSRRLGKTLADIEDPAFWDEYVQRLALVVINIAACTGINALCVGGGVVAGRPLLVKHLGERVATLSIHAAVEVMQTELGEDSPLIGASILPRMISEHCTILHQ